MEPQSDLDLIKLRDYIFASSSSISFKGDTQNLEDIISLQLQSINVAQATILKNKCKYLNKLKIERNINDKAFAIVINIQSLQSLEVSVQIDFNCAVNLYCKSLKKLLCSNLHYLIGMELFVNLPQVALELQSFGVLKSLTESDILWLTRFKSLKEVKIKYAPVKAKQIQNLVDILPNLTSLSLGYCNLTDQNLRIIARGIVTLENLNIQGNAQITYNGIQHLAKYQNSLKCLDIKGSDGLKDDGVLFITNTFTNLVHFVTLNDYLREQILQNMSINFRKLQKLEIYGQYKPLTNIAMCQFMSKMAQLTKLTIHYSCSNDIIISISQHLTQLRSIILWAYDRIYTMKIYYLSKLKNVRKVDLSANRIDSEGFVKFLRNTHSTNSNFQQNIILGEKSRRNARILMFNRHLIIKL